MQNYPPVSPNIESLPRKPLWLESRSPKQVSCPAISSCSFRCCFGKDCCCYYDDDYYYYDYYDYYDYCYYDDDYFDDYNYHYDDDDDHYY